MFLASPVLDLVSNYTTILLASLKVQLQVLKLLKQSLLLSPSGQSLVLGVRFAFMLDIDK